MSHRRIPDFDTKKLKLVENKGIMNRKKVCLSLQAFIQQKVI